MIPEDYLLALFLLDRIGEKLITSEYDPLTKEYAYEKAVETYKKFFDLNTDYPLDFFENIRVFNKVKHTTSGHVCIENSQGVCEACDYLDFASRFRNFDQDLLADKLKNP